MSDNKDQGSVDLKAELEEAKKKLAEKDSQLKEALEVNTELQKNVKAAELQAGNILPVVEHNGTFYQLKAHKIHLEGKTYEASDLKEADHKGIIAKLLELKSEILEEKSA